MHSAFWKGLMPVQLRGAIPPESLGPGGAAECNLGGLGWWPRLLKLAGQPLQSLGVCRWGKVDSVKGSVEDIRAGVGQRSLCGRTG